MKITNFNKVKTSATLNESLKKKFGYTLNIDTMSLPKAKRTLVTMKESLDAFRAKAGEKATTSKPYMEKLLVLETLSTFIAEKEAAIKLERREATLRTKLVEAEQAEAEVVLAAKDMVDSLQGMIEDLGEMQNEQLQPLVDSIRTTLGEETASGFDSSMSASLSSALDAMRMARTDADASARMLSGEAPAGDDFMGDELAMDPAVDAEMPAEELPAEIPAEEMPVDDGMGREARGEEVGL